MLFGSKRRVSRPMKSEEVIVAIIVTFHPDQNLLISLLRRLRPQIAHGLIINNDSSLAFSDDILLNEGFLLRHMSSNQGIAAAFNFGIEWALALNATKVILFDQDSTPESDMVNALVVAHDKLTEAGERVGAIGPVHVDRKTDQRAPFVVPDKKWGNYQTPERGELIEVDHLISSGCLIPVPVLQDIGPMLSSLFIDGVDIEWSWRCRAAGYKLYGSGDAGMIHSIGHDSVKVGRKRLHIHPPSRQYYIFRNLLYLKSLSYAPESWRRHCWKGLLFRFVYFCLFSKTRLAYLKCITRGILDGWRGTLGPISCKK